MDIVWSEALSINQVALSPTVKKIVKAKEINLFLGASKIKMDVLERDNTREEVIVLPKQLTEVITIPSNIPYEALVKKGEIHIGPIIAYLSMGKFNDLENRIFFLTLPKFLDYEAIKGLIFICTQDSINMNSKLIDGYYFDPKEEDSKKVWKPGKFPFPQAIFNRSFMPQKGISEIQKIIGDKVFNSYWRNLNKWNMWKVFAKDPVLMKHLPYTQRFFGGIQLEKLLARYDSLYLKPCNRSRGKGIMKVIKTTKGVLIVDNKGNKYEIEDSKSLDRFIKEKIRIPYMVQQAISTTVNNYHLDFRLLLQKDAIKAWSSSGLIARIGREGSIITNSAGRATSILGKDALTTLYKMNKEEAEKIEKEMTQLVSRAAGIYEQKGIHLGDLAADIILDGNHHIWLLELQLNYGLDGRSKVLPSEFFKKAMTTPFKYAKALAGFSTE